VIQIRKHGLIHSQIFLLLQDPIVYIQSRVKPRRVLGNEGFIDPACTVPPVFSINQIAIHQI
jgi:hypothetical protein